MVELANGAISDAEIDEIVRVCDRFATRPTYAHAFVFGARKHWMSMVVRKSPYAVFSVVAAAGAID